MQRFFSKTILGSTRHKLAQGRSASLHGKDNLAKILRGLHAQMGLIRTTEREHTVQYRYQPLIAKMIEPPGTETLNHVVLLGLRA